MKTLRFSAREYRVIETVVGRICQICGVSSQDVEYRHIAWTAILSVYRQDRGRFLPGGPGWQLAYNQAQMAIQAEKDAHYRQWYRELSLDAPVGMKQKPRESRIAGRCCQLENSVCFRDFLARLPDDLRQMAEELIKEKKLEEIRANFCWSAEYTALVFSQLHQAVVEYEAL